LGYYNGMYVYSCVLLLSNILSTAGNQLSLRELITFDSMSHLNILSTAGNQLFIRELITFYFVDPLLYVTFLADPSHAGKPLREVQRSSPCDHIWSGFKDLSLSVL
jgi:hypothetical protein